MKEREQASGSVDLITVRKGMFCLSNRLRAVGGRKTKGKC